MSYNEILASLDNSEGDKIVKHIAKAIFDGRFNYERYLNGYRLYYGWAIQTQPLFCSYGQIGFTLWFHDCHIPNIKWDWEMHEMKLVY